MTHCELLRHGKLPSSPSKVLIMKAPPRLIMLKAKAVKVAARLMDSIVIEVPLAQALNREGTSTKKSGVVSRRLKSREVKVEMPRLLSKKAGTLRNRLALKSTRTISSASMRPNRSVRGRPKRKHLAGNKSTTQATTRGLTTKGNTLVNIPTNRHRSQLPVARQLPT